MNNKLIIAAAWSGKTTYLIKNALELQKEKILITTYTSENESSIKEKIFKIFWNIPENITIKTRDSFLLQYLLRPYQSELFDELFNINIHFYQQNGRSSLYCNKQNIKYYFQIKNNIYKIYSDKISEFIFETNKKLNWILINRLSRIFNYIFIDEIQDLAWYDLELIKLISESHIKLLLVWDPRQVTYLTNSPKKNKQYSNWEVEKYIIENCKKWNFEIDKESLNVSHRNNQLICDFSSRIFPNEKSIKECNCESCNKNGIEHQWIFLVKESLVDSYCKEYHPQILKWQNANLWEMTLWLSKWKTFDRVLIYPTKPIKNRLYKWTSLEFQSRCKLYVWVTRARYSVWFVVDDEDLDIEWIQTFIP